MQIVIVCLLLGLSAILLYQDFSSRQIHIIPLLAFVVLAAFLRYNENLFLKIFLLESLLNLLVLILILFCLFIYIKFIRKKPMFEMIGLGDLIFFLAFVFGFETTSFVIHFAMAMIFSLAIHLLFKSTYNKYRSVPLAGYMAVFFSFDKASVIIENL